MQSSMDMNQKRESELWSSLNKLDIKPNRSLRPFNCEHAKEYNGKRTYPNALMVSFHQAA